MQKIHLQIFTLIFSFSTINYILYNPEVSAQSYGRYRYLKPIGNFLEGIVRGIPPIRPNYRIIRAEVDKYGQVITHVGKASTVYTIIFDCRQGLVSRDIQNLPLEERRHLFTTICRQIPK